MKMYEIEASLHYYEDDNIFITFLKKLFKIHPTTETMYMDIFVYNHEDVFSVVSSILHKLYIKDMGGYSPEDSKNIKCFISIKKELRSIDEVKVVLIPNMDQWIRYNRVLRHPNFNWDKYVTMEWKKHSKFTEEVKFIPFSSFIEKYPCVKTGEIKSHFCIVPTEPIDKKSYEYNMGSFDVRYCVADPFFFSEEEKEEFEKDESANGDSYHLDFLNDISEKIKEEEEK